MLNSTSASGYLQAPPLLPLQTQTPPLRMGQQRLVAMRLLRFHGWSGWLGACESLCTTESGPSRRC